MANWTSTIDSASQRTALPVARLIASSLSAIRSIALS